MVVQGHVTQQCLLQILTTAEPVGLQDIGNAAIEPLHHAVGSGCSGLGQSVLYAKCLAQLVKLMIAAGLAFAGGKQAVRELLAVVGQQLFDLDRAGLVQGIEEGFGTGSCLVSLDGHKHPARGPVNSHEQVTPLGLVLHLGQVLHIHVKEPRLVALEGLVRLLWGGGFEGIQVAHAVAAQAPVQPRARDIRAQEFARDGQQIIEGQQQCAAQMDDNNLLRRTELGLQAVRRVRAVAKDLTLLPLVDRLLGNAVAAGQGTGGLCAGSDLGAYSWRGAGILVQGNQHDVLLPVDCSDFINSLSTARAMNNG